MAREEHAAQGRTLSLAGQWPGRRRLPVLTKQPECGARDEGAGKDARRASGILVSMREGAAV